MEHASSNDSAATVAPETPAEELKDSKAPEKKEDPNVEQDEGGSQGGEEGVGGGIVSGKEIAGLRSELGDAWKPAELPDDCKSETSQQESVNSRRSKRIRKKKETFVPETRGFFKSTRSSSKQAVPREEPNQSSSIPPKGEGPWGILPPPIEEEHWEEAVLCKENVLGQDARTIGQVVSAVSKQLSRDPNRAGIDWKAISKKLKVKKVSLSPPLCQAIWRLAAYKVTVNGEITDRKIRKRRTLEATEVKDDDSDIDEIPLLPGSKLCRDLNGVPLSRYFPDPPYSRYSNEEAWEDTGLKRMFMDQQCLPSYNWKNEDDFNLITAVLATNSYDWDKIKEASHLVDIKMLSCDTLKKRFLQLEKNIREQRLG